VCCWERLGAITRGCWGAGRADGPGERLLRAQSSDFGASSGRLDAIDAGGAHFPTNTMTGGSPGL
jgi:hypothetical protein